MTIVICDGNILAADSLSSESYGAKPTGGALRAKRRCKKCNADEGTYFFSKKIDGYKKDTDIHWDGKNIVATAKVGHLQQSDFILELLRVNADVEKACSAYAKALLNPINNDGGYLVIMTEDSVFCLGLTWKGLKVEEIKDFPFCIGSGAEVAKFASQSLGLDIFEALECAKIAVPSCGGDTLYVSRNLVVDGEYAVQVYTPDPGLPERLKSAPVKTSVSARKNKK